MNLSKICILSSREFCWLLIIRKISQTKTTRLLSAVIDVCKFKQTLLIGKKNSNNKAKVFRIYQAVKFQSLSISILIPAAVETEVHSRVIRNRKYAVEEEKPVVRSLSRYGYWARFYERFYMMRIINFSLESFATTVKVSARKVSDSLPLMKWRHSEKLFAY